MSAALHLAAALAVIAGFIHSGLGEWRILPRLLRREVDRRPSDRMVRIVRIAWHAPSIAWWGFAAMLVLIARDAATPRNLGVAMGLVFLCTAAFLLAGRLWPWLIFATIAAITLVATRQAAI